MNTDPRPFLHPDGTRSRYGWGLATYSPRDEYDEEDGHDDVA